METPKFSVVVWTRDTNEVYFRDFIESMVSQTYDAWELYVMDEGNSNRIATIVAEFFPADDRIHYRQLKTNKGKAYAYNMGFHFVLVNAAKKGIESQEKGYIVIADQHDRLSSNTLSAMAESASDMPDVIYTDHDELVGADRMAPCFKPSLNKELFMHRNYIGEFFAISHGAARRIGEFQEKLSYASVYDYLLRAVELELKFVRIPLLLYHRRVLPVSDKKAYRKWMEKQRTEHMLVVQASMKRRGIAAAVEKGPDDSYWNVTYDGTDALSHEKEYMILRSKDVKPLTRNNIERMYGYLRQKDVAVVGARFIKRGFSIENCGYIYDENGMSYPAFYDRKIYRPTYEQIASIPRDVSMVDADYCMIDAKVYRKLGGFDPSFSGRDVMLDFCLRVQQAGLRVIVDPAIIARSNPRQIESSESSNERLLEKWGEVLKKGDPLYNPNMMMGLENYQLF